MVKCHEPGCTNDALERPFGHWSWPNGAGLPNFHDVYLCDQHAREQVRGYKGADGKSEPINQQTSTIQ